ncbi:nuclear transport factor 2 family protein [Mangrovibacterium marinum]|uniref:Ketosteroid isomerase-like protein n=1 Tax=Mangrovibacterium marinum TaxID=1639118 RepID=A0A2T5C2C2_9BACT|nr:nuclear transport factor 2 family protein [Mangrovibacterium marinum]PTN08849.1 ketosteroid isomerase-like protein [Mangrovibacterium marinum]
MNNESREPFKLEEAKQGVESSIRGFSEALAAGDAKAASNYYTEDAVFMPHNSPIVTGRGNIEAALDGFIQAGFTKLKVESTWATGCGEYLVDTEKWTLSNGDVQLIGKSIVVWKLEDGIWRQYKDMINTDTPEPVPVE